MFRQLYRKLCELKIDIRRNLIYKQLFLSFLMAVSIAACDSEAWYSKSSDRDTEVSIVRVCCGNLATDVKNSFIGTILNDVGFSRPPAQDIEVKNGLVFLSEELIADMNGDIIFVIVDKDEDSQKVFEQLQQKPLWNQLKAVQQGQVYPVNLPTWRGGNPLAADAVIDDLFEYLVEKQENS